MLIYTSTLKTGTHKVSYSQVQDVSDFNYTASVLHTQRV